MTGVSIHLLFIYIHIVRKDKGLTRISTHFINNSINIINQKTEMKRGFLLSSILQ